MQLAAGDRVLVVPLLHAASSLLAAASSPLARVLADPSIAKVGVGVRADARKLSKDWGLAVEGLVDLAQEARSLGLPGVRSLASAAEHLAGAALSKAKATALSNWEQDAARWSRAMLPYAALDALAPFSNAASWDNTGLLIEPPRAHALSAWTPHQQR